jgi:ABC-type multidrug transport system ATPase subunit
MITFTNLTKRFGSYTAVDNLTLQVDEREAVALWGPNGAGKTTAVKCLLGLLAYDGRITVNGYDAKKQGRQARATIGYVPQQQSFYDDLTTLDTALFFAKLKRTPAAEAPALLAQVGLGDHLRKAVGALSGGMKQRLALALALQGDPPVLVMDEPTSNLDAAARDQLLHLLAEVKAAGKTIIFSSHRIEEVETLADRVLVMEKGQVRFTCTPRELPSRLGWRSEVKLRMEAGALDAALHVLQAGGFTARRNGVGVIVEVPHGEKARPIHVLRGADITVTDFEME